MSVNETQPKHVLMIKRLIDIQKRDKLTDNDISQRLKLHPISWNRIKKGRAGYSEEFIKRAVRAYPEIAAAVLEDIFGENWRQVVSTLMTQIVDEMKRG